jgi:hypothetical protein
MRGAVSLWLYKENKLWDWKNVFSLRIPLWALPHLWLLCSNFFNLSKKNYFVCVENNKIGKAKDGWRFVAFFFFSKYGVLFIWELRFSLWCEFRLQCCGMCFHLQIPILKI